MVGKGGQVHSCAVSTPGQVSWPCAGLSAKPGLQLLVVHMHTGNHTAAHMHQCLRASTPR